MMRFPSRKIVFVVILCVCAGLLFSLLLFFQYVTNPTDSGGAKVTVEISRGSGFSAIARLLEARGVISSRRAFYALALLKGNATLVQAGEYELSASMSPEEVLDTLVKGRVKQYRIVIPEGFTVRQIAFRLTSNRLADEKRFLALASDAQFLSTLGITCGNAEGYLFPETYFFTRSMNEKDIMKSMVEVFRRKIIPMTIKSGGFTVHEIITLASIIEKEGGIQSERPLISAVLHNRLARKMRLQSDPTVIYAIRDFDGKLTEEHLKITSPYNTYKIQGLPPGPVCNPGISAINAALHPAKSDYLYFVSKNDGSHYFSSNLQDHTRAVARYQLQKN